MAKILRVKLNHQVLVKSAQLVSNSVLLAANTYMIGSGLRQGWRNRQQDRIHQNLELAAEVSTALAGLTRVISETIGNHHARS